MGRLALGPPEEKVGVQGWLELWGRTGFHRRQTPPGNPFYVGTGIGLDCTVLICVVFGLYLFVLINEISYRRPECKSSTIEFIAPQVKSINIIHVVGFVDPILVEKESSCQIFIP